MQSWGTRSRFQIRDTEHEPTKSGVLGLICAAFGKPRDDRPGHWPSLPELCRLRMGVRILSPGKLSVDYQTAGGGNFPGLSKYGVWTASGKVGGTVVSERSFLADADFLVGLEGDTALLTQIHSALKAPVWPIFLGRKSYVSSLPVYESIDGRPSIQPMPLEQALKAARMGNDRMALEVPINGALETRSDVPLSYLTRTFGTRGIETSWSET